MKCSGCGRKLSGEQAKIAKALGAKNVLCKKCTKGSPFWKAYQRVKKAHAKTLKKLKD